MRLSTLLILGVFSFPAMRAAGQMTFYHEVAFIYGKTRKLQGQLISRTSKKDNQMPRIVSSVNYLKFYLSE